MKTAIFVEDTHTKKEEIKQQTNKKESDSPKLKGGGKIKQCKCIMHKNIAQHKCYTPTQEPIIQIYNITLFTVQQMKRKGM